MVLPYYLYTQLSQQFISPLPCLKHLCFSLVHILSIYLQIIKRFFYFFFHKEDAIIYLFLNVFSIKIK